MKPKHRRGSPEYKWEKALIDAYVDFRWHGVLDPFYEQFQQWKAGKLSHVDLAEALHETHEESQLLYSFLGVRVFRGEHRRDLMWLIQADGDWFMAWLREHPAPLGIELESFVEGTDSEEHIDR